MVTTTSSSNCPRCGAAVDPSLAGGVCPACLLRAVALGTAADSLPAAPWVPPAVSELAAAFPQLEIVELIGHGGMGAVYKARQKSLGRWVALKILAPQHASKADFAERFSREAKVLAEVNHPHIVTVHDFGQAGEFYFLLMEFVDGVSLRQAMRAGRFTPEQALSIVPPICEALQFAHEHGIVHRDIKPENLLLDKEGRVKIADFGIARMMRSADDLSSLPSPPGRGAGGEGSRHTDIDLTQEAVLGTPRYMAPEQRDRPASVDHRADIYSLGVVLYEMLTGELPGPNWQPPSRQSAADVRLDQIVQRALEQNPDLRYQSATELRTQIETSITQLPPDVASQLLDEADDDAALEEVNALMGDMNVAFAWWDKLYVIIYFMLAVVISNWVFGFPHFSPTSSELNALLYGFALAIVGGVGWIVVRFFLRRRGAKPQPDNGVVTATSATHRDSTPNKPSGNFLAESQGVFQEVFRETLDEMFQTSLGLRVFLFGCFVILIGLWPQPNVQVLYRLLGFVGLALLLKVAHRNLKTPLPPKHVPPSTVGQLPETVFDRLFNRGQSHWLSAYLRTGQGRVLYLFGSLGLLAFSEQFHPLIQGGFGGIALLGLMAILTFRDPRKAIRSPTSSSSPDESPTAGNRRDTVLDRMFGRDQPHWLHAYFQTDLGRRLFVYGCFGFLGTYGLFHPSLQPLTVFFGLFGLVGLAALVEIRHRRKSLNSTAPSFLPEHSHFLGLRSVWARRFLAISWLGFFGFLGSVPGLERAAGMFGFSGFVGVATIAEFWNRHGKKGGKRWKLVTGVAVAIAVYLGVALYVIPEFKTHADVVMRNPAMEGSYFVFDHEVECPPGWNVWVTLSSWHGSQRESYQAKLEGTGHVRLPVRLMTQEIGDSSPTLPPRVEAYRLAPRHGAGWTLFGDGLASASNHSRKGGNVTLWMYPEGESPASQDRVPYTTIKPPSRPQSAPFVASYELGKIEVVRLTPHPSDGQIQWMPNGQPCTEQFLPDRGGRSSASDRVIKEITVRVLSNTREPSWPVLRFPEKSGFSGMGSSFHRATDEQPATIMVQTIACPPEAREMTVEVGVADGAWKNEISFEPGDYRSDRHHGRSTSGGPGGDWQGTVQVTDAVGDKLPVSFSYTDRDDADTRLVYELADGKLVTMPDTSGLGDSRTGLITISVSEFEKIKQFHVQSRRYQWTEFRNVSLELGHKTEVEISDAY